MTDVWTRIRSTSKPIFLYGMGNGADKLIDILKDMGIRPEGVFASDDFVRHQLFRGFTVSSYAEAKCVFPEMMVLIAFGSSLEDVMGNMKRIASEQETYAPCLPLFGKEVFDQPFYDTHKDELDTVRSFLSDDVSVRTFDSVISYKLTGSMEKLFSCEMPRIETFSLFSLGEAPCYFDAGAYDGDTIREFVSLYPSHGKIYGAEPDIRTFRKLVSNTSDIPSTMLWNTCTGDKDSMISFASRGGRNSSVGTGKKVALSRIDTITSGNRVDLIKYDVEGEELSSLMGSELTIGKYRPVLIVSAYHRSEDLYSLPLFIKKLCPDYRVYMRHYPYVPDWDTNYIFV
jgi:FkbM family methyltransferase